ncbi:hypothetical protein TNIN_171481 [Trichonephila inaurata madagascariensis]|uniref:Uncharacterized protein n=1 Tax=Trichonephila inaurata madagascariensis TaxID=2747483 RepID=A0A8X7CEB7_9ARAC|nr:hypothetical protein TNIN_171481 [Trichonephila inaurata madagascariensis]
MENPESHSVMKTKLTEEVVAKDSSCVSSDWQSNEILSRCTSEVSQNAMVAVLSGVTAQTESFNQKKRLEISVVTAVSEFNFGSLFTAETCTSESSLPRTNR